MADTAIALAKSGIVTDKNLADSLVSTAGKVRNAPTVIAESVVMMFFLF